MAVLARQVLYLEIATIERDAELQARVGLNANVVKDYAEQMAAGAAFPPVVVFARPGAHALVDGFHRVAARESLGHTTVLAETREGTREEAIWYGLTANQKHGLRRTNEDKQCCVVKALIHPRAQALSDRQLANHCGVHHYTVSRIRQQLERNQVIEVRDSRIVTRGGVSYSQRLQKHRSSTLSRDPRPSDRVEAALEPSNSCERIRQLIRQAHGSLDKALEEISSARSETDRDLKRLFLHLTHLRRELSSAEHRLADAPPSVPAADSCSVTGSPAYSGGQ
ncbi:MAG TPA: hypothetical protein VGI70_22170 [Polyangiales bacterium]|jgi:DNA-binding transcriptional regulator YhcF (GntR family)